VRSRGGLRRERGQDALAAALIEECLVADEDIAGRRVAGAAISARKRSVDAKLLSEAARDGLAEGAGIRRTQHIVDQGVGEAAGQAVDGGRVLADKSGEVLRGLVLLAIAERVVR